MANASATILCHQGTSVVISYAPSLVHPTGGGKYNPQNMNPLQLVAKCMLVDQVCFCVAGFELCTKIGFKVTSAVQLCY